MSRRITRVDAPGAAPRLAAADDLPPPGRGEVTVRMHAAGLNFADILMIDGRYQETPPFPFVAGIEGSIRRDLSVDGMDPTLVLPTMAGFNQGPGFGNLSCLGLLADRILGGIVGDADGLVSVGARAVSDRA